MKFFDLLPSRLGIAQSGFADGDHVAKHLNSQFAQKEFGQRAHRHPGSRLPGRGPLQYVPRFRKVILQRAGKVCMTRTRGGDAFMLARITRLYRQVLLPVLPIAVLQQDRDGRTNRLAMTHAGEDVGRILLDLHAATAPKALLSPP